MKNEKKQQPFDESAERAIIGGVLIDPDVIDIIDNLRPEDFYFATHGQIYRAMLEMRDAEEPIDVITLADKLDAAGKLAALGGHAALMRFVSDTPSALNAVSYASTVQRLGWLRRMIRFATDMVQKSYDGGDPDELWAWAQDTLGKMTPAKRDGSLLPGWESRQTYDRMIENIMELARQGEMDRWQWPAAWHSWNEFVRPPRPGQVSIIAAADGVGKSAYLENVAENWAQRGNQVVLVHFEDDHEYKLHRRMARWSGIPLERLEDGTLTKADLGNKERAESLMASWVDNLHYLHTPGWSMAQVLKELQRMHDDGICDIAVIDYLDKARADRRQIKIYGSNVWERQGDDMEQVKAWAEKNGVPVLTATQGNKSMQGGGLKTRASIQGTGQKSQRAQLVVILTREILESDMKLDNGQTLTAGSYSPFVQVRIDKQNRGRTLSFTQFFDGPRFRIVDIENKMIV